MPPESVLEGRNSPLSEEQFFIPTRACLPILLREHRLVVMGDDVEIKAGKPKLETDDEVKRKAKDDHEKEQDDRYRKEISNPHRVTD